MELRRLEYYRQYDLPVGALDRLALFADLLLASADNVTAVRDPEAVEDRHLLDSLSLLHLPEVRAAGSLVDIGSGGGLPAVVLAVARPDLTVTAVESTGKKCRFISSVGERLGLDNLIVTCARAEDLGRGAARETFDVAVVRAVASLPAIAELAAPLLRIGGLFAGMKGAVDPEERLQGERALAILGCGRLEGRRVESFPGAENRWLYLSVKERPTPAAYPRRPGVPQKSPLGGRTK